MKSFKQYMAEEEMKFGEGEVIKKKEEDTPSDSKEMKFGKGAVIKPKATKGLTDTKPDEQNLNEYGFKKALDTGNADLMKKELAKRRERSERLEADATLLNQLPNHKGALAAYTKFSQAQALKPGIEDLTMPLEAQGIKTGVKLRELPTEKPWQDELTPDYYDGPDENQKGSSSEVESAQQQNQFSGNLQKPFPSSVEMAANFMSRSASDKKPTPSGFAKQIKF